MTPGRIYLDTLEDILDALLKSRDFVEGMSYEEFAQDDKTVFAVIRALEVVGEGAKQIPKEIRRRHSTVPWRGMAGMRDKLIHHYFAIDLSVVWKTVIEDVPALIPVMREVIDQETASA